MYGRKVMLRLFWAIVFIISMMIMTMMVGCYGRQKQKEIGVYNVGFFQT